VLKIPVRRCDPCPPEAPRGYKGDVMETNPAHTAFMLVDVYMPPRELGLVTFSQADYEAKGRIVRENIAPALATARKVGLPVVYVANSAPRIALEQSAFGKQLQAVGTDFLREFAEETVDPLEYQRGPSESLVYPDVIAPQPGDYYVRKHVYSGFYATRLESLLRNLDVTALIGVGFRLDACLGLTLMDAHYRNLQVILLRDCTIACDAPEEQAARTFTKRMILWHETLIGPTSTSAEFVAACERAPLGSEILGLAHDP
jgi:nicotinamidase-related amidase